LPLLSPFFFPLLLPLGLGIEMNFFRVWSFGFGKGGPSLLVPSGLLIRFNLLSCSSRCAGIVVFLLVWSCAQGRGRSGFLVSSSIGRGHPPPGLAPRAKTLSRSHSSREAGAWPLGGCAGAASSRVQRAQGGRGAQQQPCSSRPWPWPLQHRRWSDSSTAAGAAARRWPRRCAAGRVDQGAARSKEEPSLDCFAVFCRCPRQASSVCFVWEIQGEFEANFQQAFTCPYPVR